MPPVPHEAPRRSRTWRRDRRAPPAPAFALLVDRDRAAGHVAGVFGQRHRGRAARVAIGPGDRDVEVRHGDLAGTRPDARLGAVALAIRHLADDAALLARHAVLLD